MSKWTISSGLWLFALILVVSSPCANAREVENVAAGGDSQLVPLLPPSVPTALMIAGALSEKGDYEGALQHYHYALQQDPGNREIGQRYVGLALRMGRLGDALGALDTMLEKNPADRELRMQKIRLYLLGAKADKAEPLSGTLLEDFPSDNEVIGLRVEVLQRVGRLDEAIRLQAGRWEEDHGDPVVGRAYAALLLGTKIAQEKEKGESILRELLDKDPGDSASADLLVNHLREEGRDAEAIALLEELVARVPDENDQLRLLADLYLAQDRDSDACDLLLPLAREGKLDRHDQIVLTDLFVRLQRYDEAWELARTFLHNGEEDGLVLQMVGEIAMEQGELENAEIALGRALKLRPNDPAILVSLLLSMSRRYPDLNGGQADAKKGEEESDEVVRERYRRLLVLAQGIVEEDSFRQNLILGVMLRRSGQASEAIIPLSRAQDLRPKNTQALYDLAWAQEEASQYKEACDTLERLLKLQPHEASLLNFYGYLLADQNWELEKARTMIEEAVQKEPENPYYLDSLGWVLYRQGHFEEALARLIDAANRLGDDLTVLQHTGDTLTALRRYQTALQIYERALKLGGDRDLLQPKIDKVKERLKSAP